MTKLVIDVKSLKQVLCQIIAETTKQALKAYNSIPMVKMIVPTQLEVNLQNPEYDTNKIRSRGNIYDR